jgi:hypothetical protein
MSERIHSDEIAHASALVERDRERLALAVGNLEERVSLNSRRVMTVLTVLKTIQRVRGFVKGGRRMMEGAAAARETLQRIRERRSPKSRTREVLDGMSERLGTSVMPMAAGALVVCATGILVIRVRRRARARLKRQERFQPVLLPRPASREEVDYELTDEEIRRAA